MSAANLICLATSSKDDALALQVFVDSCSLEATSHLAACVLPHLAVLVGHSTGNFVVQKLARQSASFAELVADHCRANFTKMAANEFSSRVMQCLIETNVNFRLHALALFRQNLDTYTQTFSAAFLVSVAVRCADSDEERDIISHTLAVNPKRWLSRKYFKRVLVAYVAVCSESALLNLFALLVRTLSGYDFFRDRYSCLVLLALVERGLPDAQCAVLECLHSRAYDLFRWSVFKYFLEHLIEKPALEQFKREINFNLKCIHQASMKVIVCNLRTFSNYNSALGLTMKKPIVIRNC